MNLLVILVFLPISVLMAFEMSDDCEFNITENKMAPGFIKKTEIRLYTLRECQAQMVFRGAPAAVFQIKPTYRNRCLVLTAKADRFLKLDREATKYMECK
jgi:hypothetical protein